MFITEDLNKRKECSFNWEKYFSDAVDMNVFEKIDYREVVEKIRNHLVENTIQMTFSLVSIIRDIFANMNMKSGPRILELGAGTGFLTKCLVEQYDGTGVLVDNNQNSYKSYNSLNDQCSKNIAYVINDIFDLNLSERFDLVCSFGLIEHFVDKMRVIDVHKKFLKQDGHILILVPQDTLLSRVFFEVHPEFNLGYRELISECELKSILSKENIEILRIQASNGYPYDFIAALCKSIS